MPYGSCRAGASPLERGRLSTCCALRHLRLLGRQRIELPRRGQLSYMP